MTHSSRAAEAIARELVAHVAQLLSLLRVEAKFAHPGEIYRGERLG